MISPNTDIDRFVTHLRARLEIGAREYGDASFTRPLVEILDEGQQELLDVAGWGFIAWVRLQRLREQVVHVERKCSEEGQPSG